MVWESRDTVFGHSHVSFHSTQNCAFCSLFAYNFADNTLQVYTTGSMKYIATLWPKTINTEVSLSAQHGSCTHLAMNSKKSNVKKVIKNSAS